MQEIIQNADLLGQTKQSIKKQPIKPSIKVPSQFLDSEKRGKELMLDIFKQQISNLKSAGFITISNEIKIQPLVPSAEDLEVPYKLFDDPDRFQNQPNIELLEYKVEVLKHMKHVKYLVKVGSCIDPYDQE